MLDGRAYVYVTFGSSGPGAPSECHGLDADRRVWLQRLVQEAYMSLIDDMDSGEAARAGPGVPGRYLYSLN